MRMLLSVRHDFGAVGLLASHARMVLSQMLPQLVLPFKAICVCWTGLIWTNMIPRLPMNSLHMTFEVEHFAEGLAIGAARKIAKQRISMDIFDVLRKLRMNFECGFGSTIRLGAFPLDR